MKNPDLKMVNGFYFSRLIDSLEKDYKEWRREGHSSYIGSYYEYKSPEYKNSESKRIQFTIGDVTDGAYVDGYLRWDLGFFQKYNLFSYRTRRFWVSYWRMRYYVKQKIESKYTEELMKSL
jgi:hypothetical protein